MAILSCGRFDASVLSILVGLKDQLLLAAHDGSSVHSEVVFGCLAWEDSLPSPDISYFFDHLAPRQYLRELSDNFY